MSDQTTIVLVVSPETKAEIVAEAEAQELSVTDLVLMVFGRHKRQVDRVKEKRAAAPKLDTFVPRPIAERAGGIAARARTVAKRHGVDSDLTVPQVVAIVQAAEGVCSYCKKKVGEDRLIVDHVLTMARGGANTASNLTPCCRRCNRRKNSLPANTMPRVNDPE